MQIHPVMYHFLTGALLNPVCKGRVLNVGLGPGYSARLLLLSRRVTGVVSVEINPDVISAYRAKYPDTGPLESRHTIVEGNAATVPGNAINPPFDWVYIDTIVAFEDNVLDTVKAVMTRLALPGALTEGGCVTIQTYRDHKKIRQFRVWLEDNGWTEDVIRPALAENAIAHAAAMTVWRPPTGGN